LYGAKKKEEEESRRGRERRAQSGEGEKKRRKRDDSRDDGSEEGRPRAQNTAKKGAHTRGQRGELLRGWGRKVRRGVLRRETSNPTTEGPGIACHCQSLPKRVQTTQKQCWNIE
jgi:hypothetical protein